MPPQVLNLKDEASRLTEQWSPRVVAELNGQFVKVARIEGEFVWHDHAGEDEMFLVLQGSLKIQFEDGEIVLNQGDCCVVPRGVRHNPIAKSECYLALFEPASTAHTGDVVHPKTRSVAEQLAKDKHLR